MTFTEKERTWLREGLLCLRYSMTGEQFDDPADQAKVDAQIAEIDALDERLR